MSSNNRNRFWYTDLICGEIQNIIQILNLYDEYVIALSTLNYYPIRRFYQRVRQLNMAMQTSGYYNRYLGYYKNIENTEEFPIPKPAVFSSKRSWDGQLRRWRRYLHKFDGDGIIAVVKSDRDIVPFWTPEKKILIYNWNNDGLSRYNTPESNPTEPS